MSGQVHWGLPTHILHKKRSLPQGRFPLRRPWPSTHEGEFSPALEEHQADTWRGADRRHRVGGQGRPPEEGPWAIGGSRWRAEWAQGMFTMVSSSVLSSRRPPDIPGRGRPCKRGWTSLGHTPPVPRLLRAQQGCSTSPRATSTHGSK